MKNLMKNRRLRKIITASLLDGFTGAGLFGHLRRPGAPDTLIDTRNLQEWAQSGEFSDTVSAYSEAREDFHRARNARGRIQENRRRKSEDPDTSS
jgi:hypothetical protein